MSQPRTIAGDAAYLRAIAIDPWARAAVPAQLGAVERPCGCWDCDGLALVEILGRRQRAYVVLNGSETLIAGLDVVAPRWTWGASIVCRGWGVILGGRYSHAFSDSAATLDQVLACVAFPARRRARAEAA